MQNTVLFDPYMSKTVETGMQELQKRFPAALDYLTEIFLLHREFGQVSNSKLAQALKVSKPAVTQAVNRLKKHKLAEQDLYGTIRLTPTGRIYASRILKRHYLIEHLLIQKLDYPWHKSDEEAQRLQGSISEEFTEHLYEAFGHPETCPHGNPFPGSTMEKLLVAAPRIPEAPKNQRVKLIRITEMGEAVDGLLEFCHRHNLHPGRDITILNKDDKTVYIGCCGEKEISIPMEIAQHLCYDSE